MKKTFFIFWLACISLSVMAGGNQQKTSPVLKGPYLGQTPPGMEPEVFAPGIISTEHQEHSSLAISPDGKEMFWSIWERPHKKGNPQIIRYTQFKNGRWTKPRTAPFSGKYMDGGPCFSPDGNQIIFYSKRPLDQKGEPKKDIDLWVVERTDTGWGIPEHMGFVINSEKFEGSPAFAPNRDLYFSAGSQKDGISGFSVDIYISRYHNGRYTKPENLGDRINTPHAREAYPCIGQDGDFLIYSSDSRAFSPEGEFLGGDRNMLISFRSEDGLWGKPINMGSIFNRDKARFPALSPDGQYFFFTRYVGGGNEDFFWVDTKVIRDLGKTRFPGIKGPYLGERSPGIKPKIFAPQIISTDKDEINGVFTPDGKEFYFSRDTYRNRSKAGKEYNILFSQQKDTGWTAPVTAPFSGEYMDGDMCFNRDGTMMIFCSDRPVSKDGGRKPDSDLWMVKKTSTGWTKPMHLGFPVNSTKNEWYPCLTGDDTLYFSSGRGGGLGSSDIYCSKYSDGVFQKPENIGTPVNSQFNENDIYVSPDENFLIVISSKRPDTLGSGDMYISFKDGKKWGVPKNMGKPFNSKELEYCPMVTPDGKYLFFTSRRRGTDDIYWVSSKVIENLKEEKLNGDKNGKN